VERPNRFSLDPVGLPVLLENNMFDSKEYNKKWRKEHPLQVKENWKQWYDKNQDKLKAYRKIHGKIYSDNHKEERKEYKKHYYLINKKEIIAKTTLYHQTPRGKEVHKLACMNYVRSPKGRLLKKANTANRRFFIKDSLVAILQQVYEENIAKYGTLTCYLCLKPILFGNDQLEHKIPLSRGGSNERSNLDVACQKCNYKKHNKTETEFKKEIR
jgi:5-methylcytosine-specific restriction endonuclease McrA